jgi:hypothetical protein
MLSYRRSDGENLTGRLYLELTDRGYDVFWDRVCLGATTSFDQQLAEAVRSTPVFIAVLTRGYLDLGRFNNVEDWCRRELALAVEAKRHIVPVADHGFEPFEIYSHLHSQQLRLRLQGAQTVGISNAFFSASVARIVEFASQCDVALEPPPVAAWHGLDTASSRIQSLAPAGPTTRLFGGILELRYEAQDVSRVEIVALHDDRILQTIEQRLLVQPGTNTFSWSIPAASHSASDTIEVKVRMSSCANPAVACEWGYITLVSTAPPVSKEPRPLPKPDRLGTVDGHGIGSMQPTWTSEPQSSQSWHNQSRPVDPAVVVTVGTQPSSLPDTVELFVKEIGPEENGIVLPKILANLSLAEARESVNRSLFFGERRETPWFFMRTSSTGLVVRVPPEAEKDFKVASFRSTSKPDEAFIEVKVIGARGFAAAE